MNEAQASGARIAIVTVHGTNDTAVGVEGPKWFQIGSEFESQLKRELSAEGIEADVHPLLWSGANSATAREQASRALASQIADLALSYDGIHVVAHSHGGNVANDAACMMNWSEKQRRPKIASITTVGTPFFRTQVTASARLGGYAFGLLAVCSAVILLGVVFSALRFVQTNGSVASLSQRDQALVLVDLIGALALIFIFPVAYRGVQRIRRASRRKRGGVCVFALWHPQDEAISILRRVESIVLQPFPRWSFLRGSRTGGILWGVRAVIAAPLLGALVLLEDTLLRNAGQRVEFQEFGFGGAALSSIGILIVLFGIAGAPLIFGAVYFVYRLVVLVLLEFGLRLPLNSAVSEAARGIVFGRDGDNRIGEVSSTSHYYATRTLVLDGEVAKRMLDNSSAAAARLFDKYRFGLFGTEADQNEALQDMAKDAMTWDSLVHTTYFDQPEVAHAIAGHISDAARNRISAPPLVSEPSGQQRRSTKPRTRSAYAVLCGVLLLAAGVVVTLGVIGRVAVSTMASLNNDELAGGSPIIAPPNPYLMGQALRDCAQCPELVVLAGGAFTMGSPTTEEGRDLSEGPLRRVAVQPLAVGKYEVTYGEWSACVRDGGCADNAATRLFNDDLRPGDRDRQPVTDVSWDDAQEYVRWLSRTTGRNYRLLSEAEWEYAARATSSGANAWGSAPPSCDRQALSGVFFIGCGEIAGAPPAGPEAVGSFQPNAFGLHDMQGNVSEWVQDCFVDRYTGLPRNGLAYETEHCDGRVIRGGNWISEADALRTSHRNWSYREQKSPSVGFRVARAL